MAARQIVAKTCQNLQRVDFSGVSEAVGAPILRTRSGFCRHLRLLFVGCDPLLSSAAETTDKIRYLHLNGPRIADPTWLGPRIILVASFRELAASCVEFAEHFHQVADLDILERTHGILNLLARFLRGVASRELVGLRLDLAPGKGSVRAAWVG
jgi:hypothetical protein